MNFISNWLITKCFSDFYKLSSNKDISLWPNCIFEQIIVITLFVYLHKINKKKLIWILK
jgi:hypothetical protein